LLSEDAVLRPRGKAAGAPPPAFGSQAQMAPGVCSRIALGHFDHFGPHCCGQRCTTRRMSVVARGPGSTGGDTQTNVFRIATCGKNVRLQQSHRSMLALGATDIARFAWPETTLPAMFSRGRRRLRDTGHKIRPPRCNRWGSCIVSTQGARKGVLKFPAEGLLARYRSLSKP
jgi:hypothetical protein